MNVLVIGEFSETVRGRIAACFPAGWTVRVTGPEEAGAFLGEAEAVIPEHVRVDGAFLDRAPRLKMVQTGAGYDNVDVAACTGRGVWVCNAAGVNASAVAEHVMALMLSWYRNIPLLDRYMKGGGTGVPDYAGGELVGRTVGIVGLGHIGRRVAGYCGALGMRVLGWSRRGDAPPCGEAADLDRIWAESDVVTLHVPLNADTFHLVDRGVLERMRREALLINTARGGVVCEADLTQALARRQIAGACLDVYEEEPLPAESPLRRLPNVILTPHTAGYPDGARFHAGRYRFFAENIRRQAEGLTPENPVNDV